MNGKNVQCSLYFDKHRNFGGQDADQIILTCSEQGEWKLYPMLDQKDFLILGYHKQGMTVEQMLKEDKSLSQSTVYRKLEFMKKRGVIK